MTKDNAEIMTQIAEYVNAASPKLEKLASIENQMKEHASKVAEKLASAGLIAPGSVKQYAKELADSGVSKFASTIEDLIRDRMSALPKLGKAASVSTEARPRTADEVWDAHFGLKNT